MDWELAIEKNREALSRILATLFAMIGTAAGGRMVSTATQAPVLPGKATAAYTLPRHLHRLLLRLLRPTEAAARRLIIVAARGLAIEVPPLRPRKPKPQSILVRNGVGTGVMLAAGRSANAFGMAGRQTDVVEAALPGQRLALPLFDPLKHFGTRRRYVASIAAPRISFFDGFDRPRLPDPLPLSSDDPLDANRLSRRLEAVASALDDLPRQAKRFARWQARRDARLAVGITGDRGDGSTATAGKHRPQRLSPLRPGHPPGWRRRRDHPVDDILRNLHSLAVWAMARPDTS